MGGIAGASSTETVQSLLTAMQHRGQSTVSTDTGTNFVLGHLQHPLNGHGGQPSHGEGTLVANCELYRRQEIAERYGYTVDSDADLLQQLLNDHGTDVLNELDGVYAFAYQQNGVLVLARDVLGVKPLWYADPVEHDEFVFASERQALERNGYTARELHPRHILRYDMEHGTVSREQRDFFTIQDEQEPSIETAVDGITERFLDAVEKRVPDTEVALLFSGGVDSTMTAVALQHLGVDVTCYTAGIQHGNVDRPKDVEWAERVANQLGLELRTEMLTLDDVRHTVPDLVDWLSSTSVVDIGVALTFHHALQGDEPTVFSGMGSEQLYAGYSRQKGYLNRECLSDLRRMWQDDLYRDDVITNRTHTELRLPFLDHGLIRHAFTLPDALKVQDGYRKYVLRKAAEELGVPKDVAWRKKKAAQYGSNFDKALSRLAKDAGSTGKQAYLNQYRNAPDRRLAALFSGGKDSNAALYRMVQRNNEIRCLVNLQSRNTDSYMFDTKPQQQIQRQSQQLGIPLLMQETDGVKEDELEDLETALERAKQEYGIDGVVAGALASTYQRDRVEQVAERVGLAVFAPLWQEDPASYMRWLIREGFQIQITKVAARGLDTDWEGRVLDEDSVEELIALSEEYRFNAAGEGGEYETVVVDGPLFTGPATATSDPS